MESSTSEVFWVCAKPSHFRGIAHTTCDLFETTCDLFEHDESRLGSAQNLKLKLQISYMREGANQLPENFFREFQKNRRNLFPIMVFK